MPDRIMYKHILMLIISFISISFPVFALDPQFELDPKKLSTKQASTPQTFEKQVKPAAPAPSSRNNGSLKPGSRKKTALSERASKKHSALAAAGKKAPKSHEEKKREGLGFSLFMPPPDSGQSGVENARIVWEQLYPSRNISMEPLSIKENSYSLDLDPEIYPVMPALDGAKILIDTTGKLSPLVKSLIQQHDPEIRFVTYSRNNRNFFSNLLSAGGFYSVVENAAIDFGTDPKITINTDFKVEKSGDSSLQQDVSLLNVDRGWSRMPDILVDYLGHQGLKLVEINSSVPQEKPAAGNSIFVISDKEPSAIADKLMTALKINYDQDREVELMRRDEGISLRVKVDRYFEKNGERFVVSTAKGDAESYTLLRLLEAMKYHVVSLNPDEDFRAVSEKLLSRLRMPSTYAMQDMLPSRDLPYEIKMSGIMLRSPDNKGKTFLTGTQPGGIIGDLLELNGYTLSGSP